MTIFKETLLTIKHIERNQLPEYDNSNSRIKNIFIDIQKAFSTDFHYRKSIPINNYSEDSSFKNQLDTIISNSNSDNNRINKNIDLAGKIKTITTIGLIMSIAYPILLSIVVSPLPAALCYGFETSSVAFMAGVASIILIATAAINLIALGFIAHNSLLNQKNNTAEKRQEVTSFIQSNKETLKNKHMESYSDLPEKIVLFAQNFNTVKENMRSLGREFKEQDLFNLNFNDDSLESHLARINFALVWDKNVLIATGKKLETPPNDLESLRHILQQYIPNSQRNDVPMVTQQSSTIETLEALVTLGRKSLRDHDPLRKKISDMIKDIQELEVSRQAQ